MTTLATTAETGTQHQFGYEWDIYREILPMHEEQFSRWIAPVPVSYFRGKTFLDAGCGIGRNSFWALRAGASHGYAFDYDEKTVAVAKQNLRSFRNCDVTLRSIYDLQMKNQVDIAFSVGVIHHLQDPKTAVTNLVGALKPNGTLILWVYGYEGNERYLRWIDPLRRMLTSRTPLGLTRWMAKAMTATLKTYLLFPQKKPYMKLVQRMSFRHLEAIVFDQLLPTIANYWTKQEVLDLVKGLPLADIEIHHTNKMSWTLVARKISS